MTCFFQGGDDKPLFKGINLFIQGGRARSRRTMSNRFAANASRAYFELPATLTVRPCSLSHLLNMRRKAVVVNDQYVSGCLFIVLPNNMHPSHLMPKI